MSRRHLINSSDVSVIKGFTVIGIFEHKRKLPKHTQHPSPFKKEFEVCPVRGKGFHQEKKNLSHFSKKNVAEIFSFFAFHLLSKNAKIFAFFREISRSIRNAKILRKKLLIYPSIVYIFIWSIMWKIWSFIYKFEKCLIPIISCFVSEYWSLYR